MDTTPRPFRVLNLFAFCALCFNWCAQAQPPDAPAKHDHSVAATDATPDFLTLSGLWPPASCREAHCGSMGTEFASCCDQLECIWIFLLC